MEPLRITLSVNEVVEATGLGRTAIYAEIAAGRLVARKVGRRTLIAVVDLEAWLAEQPTVKPATASATIKFKTAVIS
jgi:excisionase family DNA binding protein